MVTNLDRRIIHSPENHDVPARCRGVVVPMPNEAYHEAILATDTSRAEARRLFSLWVATSRDYLWHDPASFFCFMPYDLTGVAVFTPFTGLRLGLTAFPRLEGARKEIRLYGSTTYDIGSSMSAAYAGVQPVQRPPQLEASLEGLSLAVKSSDGRVLRVMLPSASKHNGTLVAALINAHERDRFMQPDFRKLTDMQPRPPLSYLSTMETLSLELSQPRSQIVRIKSL